MWRFKNPTRYSRRCYCHLSESATRHRVDGPAASACIATARDQDVSVFPPMQSLHCLVMVRLSEIHMELVTSVLIGCVCVTSHILGQLVNSCRVEAKVVCSSGCTCSWDSSGCVTALVSEAVWKIGIQAKHWRFTGFLKHYENEGFHGFQISFTFSDTRNIYSNLLEARSNPFKPCVHLWLISLVDLQSKATIFMAILFSTMGHSVYSPVSWNGIYSILGFSELGFSAQTFLFFLGRHSGSKAFRHSFPNQKRPRIWSLLLHESIRPDEHPPHGHFDEAGILEDSPAMRGSKAFGFGKLSESVLTASRLFPPFFFHLFVVLIFARESALFQAFLLQSESEKALTDAAPVGPPPNIPRASLAFVGEGNFVLDAEPQDLAWSPKTISVVTWPHCYRSTFFPFFFLFAHRREKIWIFSFEFLPIKFGTPSG